MASRDVVEKRVPPYLSYKTFRNFLEGLKAGLPSRIDNSTMRALSGQNQVLMKAALRFFGLIDGDGTPQPTLEKLVTAEGGERQAILKDMLERSYPGMLGTQSGNFNIGQASYAQFKEHFARLGVSGETARKAETFFLFALDDAGITVSRYIDDVRKHRVKSAPQRPALKSTSNARRLPANGADDGETDVDEASARTRVRSGAAFDLMFALVEQLPVEQQWTRRNRERWLQAVTASLDLLIEVVDSEDEDSA